MRLFVRLRRLGLVFLTDPLRGLLGGQCMAAGASRYRVGVMVWEEAQTVFKLEYNTRAQMREHTVPS